MNFDFLLSPPVAFLIYIPLVFILMWIGRILAGATRVTEMKSSVYGSGEEPPSTHASPGYKPFFLVAFFFAIIHLSILVLATTPLSPVTALYVIGLLLALLALLLG
jgi:NADH:ubiquinone oxidoreductase subunit 3 (subunit A)